MKGPFSFWTFFGITLLIDLLTLFAFLFIPEKKKDFRLFGKTVSVIIPIHRESVEDVRKTINSLYKESYPLKKVIICADKSTKDIGELVSELRGKFPNLMYVESPQISKARKINYIVQNMGSSLGDFLYVRDCKALSDGQCIKQMLTGFDNEKVAAVTSHGYLTKPSNFLARSYYWGKDWVNELGRFRKTAQRKRSAVFVVCGASTIYRVDVLQKLPIPSNSKTEDTHYTWLLQFKGYKIGVVNKAKVYAPDVDGRGLKGIKSQIRQSYRWSVGTIQCFFLEAKNMGKSKKLSFTTIIPGFLEALTYSIVLVLLPVLFFWKPIFAMAFLLGDTFFSLLGTIIFIPKKFLKTLLHYPQIFFFKYLNSMIFLASIATVTWQNLRGQRNKWSNEWVPLNEH